MFRNMKIEALGKALSILQKRYSGHLSIAEGIFPNEKPFLQATSNGFTEGLSFMSAFYVIVTAEISEEGEGVFKFSLMSYHGKNLSDYRVPMDPDGLMDTKLAFVEDLATNNIHICQGIQDLKEWKWKQFWSKSRIPPLDKVRSTFFIEPLEQDVVLRARTCKYFVTDPIRNDHPDATDYVRCEYCSIYQMERQTTLFIHRKKQLFEDNSVQNVKLEEEDELANYEDNEFVKLSARTEAFEDERRSEHKEFIKSVRKPPCQQKKTPFQDFKPEILPDQVNQEVSGVLRKVGRKSKAAAQEWIKEAAEIEVPGDDSYMDADQPGDNEPDCEGGTKRKSGAKGIGTKRKKKRNAESDDDFDPSKVEEGPSDDDGEKKSWSYKEHVDYLRIYRKDQAGNVERLNLLQKYTLFRGDRILHQCTVCLRASGQKSVVIQCIARHKQSCDLHENVQCPECQEVIERGSLNPHFEDNHPGKLSCFVCQTIIQQNSKVTLTNWPQSNKDNILREHILTSHHSAKDEHVCMDCGMVLKGKINYESHRISFHGQEPVAVCPICGKAFGKKYDLLCHTRVVHEAKTIKCTICLKPIADDCMKLRQHMKIHTGLKPFSCSMCNYASERRGNVTIHLKKQHKKTDDLANNIVEDKDLRREMEKITTQELKKMKQIAATNDNNDGAEGEDDDD